MLWLGYLAYGPRDRKQLPSPIDICNTRGIVRGVACPEGLFYGNTGFEQFQFPTIAVCVPIG